MSSFLRLDVEVNEAGGDVADNLKLVTGAGVKTTLARLLEMFEGLLSGAKSSRIRIITGAVKASGTITFTGNPANDETLTINGVTFTAKTSGATGDQFNIGANVTAHATNLAAAINASTTAKIAGVVEATSELGVVTVKCKVPGKVGNVMTLTESMANTAVSGANFTSGADTTDTDLRCGL